MKIINQVDDAWPLIQAGKIIAYPTEAVYGLGCDPWNQQAVETLLSLKQRSVSKGLIILIADWSQLEALIQAISVDQMEQVRKTWPGPVTWIFPKAATVPKWLTGQYDGIAIRMTAHPIARALCAHGPLVSTSANIGGYPPAMCQSELMLQFPEGIDVFVTGDLGGAEKPSSIYDVRTGRHIR